MTNQLLCNSCEVEVAQSYNAALSQDFFRNYMQPTITLIILTLNRMPVLPSVYDVNFRNGLKMPYNFGGFGAIQFSTNIRQNKLGLTLFHRIRFDRENARPLKGVDHFI